MYKKCDARAKLLFCLPYPYCWGGERDSEDSEDDPIVLINKVTNKYAVALYNFLVRIVNEEKRKSLNS